MKYAFTLVPGEVIPADLLGEMETATKELVDSAAMPGRQKVDVWAVYQVADQLVFKIDGRIVSAFLEHQVIIWCGNLGIRLDPSVRIQTHPNSWWPPDPDIWYHSASKKPKVEKAPKKVGFKEPKPVEVPEPEPEFESIFK